MNEDEHSNKKNDEQSRAGIVHAMSINVLVFCLNSDQEHQSLFENHCFSHLELISSGEKNGLTSDSPLLGFRSAEKIG